jgi:hypothetical protein
MNKFLEKNLKDYGSPIVVLGALALLYYFIINPLGREKRFANYDKQLTQIDSIYKKMAEVKDMKNRPVESMDEYESLWIQYDKLNKKADSIKDLLPGSYQLKSDSIKERVLHWDN